MLEIVIYIDWLKTPAGVPLRDSRKMKYNNKINVKTTKIYVIKTFSDN